MKKNTDPANPNFGSRAFYASKNNHFKLAVFGSRTLRDERVEILITEKMQELGATMIVTCQEPEGVSEVAQKVAKKYGYPLQVHFLNMQYLRGAFEQRSMEIIAEADAFLLIHDGESKGTANEHKLCIKTKKPCFYEKMEATNHSRSVGFNIESEWGKDLKDFVAELENPEK